MFSDLNREPTSDALSLRIVAKSRIARHVIAGRFSLLQGAAVFEALNRVPAQSAKLSVLDAQASRLGIRPLTDQERLCRQVIDYVASELTEDPDRQEIVVAHLEAVFMDELRKQHTIQLPDPSCFVSVEQLLEEAGAELSEQRQGIVAGNENRSARLARRTLHRIVLMSLQEKRARPYGRAPIVRCVCLLFGQWGAAIRTGPVSEAS